MPFDQARIVDDNFRRIAQWVPPLIRGDAKTLALGLRIASGSHRKIVKDYRPKTMTF